MRIIAGTAKGHRLVAPERGTRPLTARTKEAVFSALGQLVEGAAVLDLYAGSGSLGFEAMSRGASSVVFVEKAWPAVKSIVKNRDRLGFEAEVVGEAVEVFLKESTDSYDLVFVDPPFELDDHEVAKTLERLGPLLSEQATVVVHRRAKMTSGIEIPGCSMRWSRRYGDGEVSLFDRVRS